MPGKRKHRAKRKGKGGPNPYEFKRYGSANPLGSYTLPITSSSSKAQVWFDRGLRWAFGFNHEEATRCFQRALDNDPTCCMAMWGIGYVNGANYNNSVLMDGYAAFAASQKVVAMAKDTKLSDTERSLVRALEYRCAYPRFKLALPIVLSPSSLR
eukprot:1215885-Amorphochlora_amoeboformis.AAC.2